MRDRTDRERSSYGRFAGSNGELTAGLRLLARTVPVLLSSIVLILFLFIVFLIASPAWSATPAGTVISNVATANFTAAGGVPVVVPSPPATVTSVVQRTPSSLEFMLYAPGAPGAQLVSVATTSYSTSGTPAGPFSVLAAPVHVTAGAGSAPIDLSAPVPLVPATQYHLGEPVFLRLTDPDQNSDPAVAEIVIATLTDPATGDTEVLRLVETGPNTGVFTGYIQTGPGPAVPGNGVLNVASGSSLAGMYRDAKDLTDSSAAAALVDPLGRVFNSITGLGVDGATVTLINTATGLPALVYGDDGISTFPATIMSGGTAADTSGRVYTFLAGGYRFPYITPGNYRITVTPPANYRSPSQVPTGMMQSLPGAPFAIVAPGSRGEDFPVNPGPAIHIDIPIDPVGNGLWLTKTAGKPSAAIGDLVPYRLTLENTSAAALAPSVLLSDHLPAGFRYRKGSARVNGASTEPAISGDGVTISFTLGDILPATTVTVTYVLEVGAGARLGTAKNIAVATGTMGVQSNLAWATVEVTEDLFRSKATIMGRVSVDGCGDRERREESGLAGVRIFLEDGTVVVTDKNGMFHFAAVQPGSHVVQLDTATVPQRYEILACEENTRFAGRPFSQFVDLQGGTLWRADFHLGLKPKIQGEIGIELRSSVQPSPPARHDEDLRQRRVTVEYAVPIHVGAVPARNLRITVLLPEGSAPVPGSGRLNTVPIADPESADTALTFRIPEAPAGWEATLRFDATLPALGQTGQLPARASLMADTPDTGTVRTPVVENTLLRHTREDQVAVPDIVLRPQFPNLSAELSAADLKQLKQIIRDLQRSVVKHIVVTGHTDSLPITGAEAKKIFSGNKALSKARAEAVARELIRGLNLKPEQVTVFGKGPDEPVADNRTEQGRSQNRRVELKVENEKVIAWAAVKSDVGQSGMKTVPTIGNRPGDGWTAGRKPEAPSQDMPDYDQAWMTSQQTGNAWVWPPEPSYPAIAATKLAVKHDPALVPQIIQNGKVLDGLYSEGTVKRADNKLAISIWKGVHLQDGDNLFELVLTDQDGKEALRASRIIHYSGDPVKAVLLPERSQLVADGRKPVVMAVQLLDQEGYPARAGSSGEFTVDPPHVAQSRQTELQQAPLTAPTTDRVRYTVGPEGIALIELAPSAQTGEAVVHIMLGNGAHEVRAWIKPENRDWVLVGLAEGTWGYNVLRGNMESAGAGGQDEDLYREGRVALYTKGMIKGEWLLTAAYDSAKTPEGRKSLYQTVDPNKYYLLYGDATEQLHDAPSAKHIYVKLERDQFYALFGDYTTGLVVTELSRYSRNLTGFKSEFKGDRYEYNVFAADTDQAHVRDELQGDGTSGLYHLSRRNVVMNSEQVTIQSRDRFKSEVIVKQQVLTRNLDYTIDYDSGALFFKSPVASRDESFNPVFIVIEYETFDTGRTHYSYGGRGAVNLLGKRAQIGVTHVHEGTGGAEGDLTGVDASASLTPTTKVRTEIASTRTQQSGATVEGSAYLAEVQHRSEKLDAGVYTRKQETGFGLGQQNGSETGTMKYGTTFNYRIAQPMSLAGEAFRQENLGTGAVRDMAELRGRYGKQQYEFFAGLRRAEDTFVTGDSARSEQFFGGMKYQFTERLAGRLEHDQTLSSTSTNVDFPTRTTVGIDYRLTTNTTLFANEELSRGSQADTAMTRVGVKSSPWAGGQLSSSLEQQSTENGARLFATTGLKQSWQITKRWMIDGGMDRSAMIRESVYYQFNTNVPPASGATEDFTAVFLGAGFHEEKWSWTGRVERRWAETEDKSALLLGANGEVRSGLALAAGVQAFRATTPAALDRFTGDLRMAVAYRPVETRFIVLGRFDYLRSEQHGVDLPFDNWRLINNLVVNYKLENRAQVSFQYGAKYVAETIEQDDYRGYTDLTGMELRYDLSKTWDVGARASLLHSWEIGEKSTWTSASVGFKASRNLWISVGYNMTGFKDRDFSQAEFTAAGPFVKLRMKFDQVSVREAVKWFSGQ